MGQPVGVVNALGVARDLFADRAVGIRVAPPAPDAADRAGIDQLDVERAGTRAVVGADRLERCAGGHSSACFRRGGTAWWLT